MEFVRYVRKPFPVDAIQITEKNIEEIAKLVGVIQTKDDGTKVIMVDRRKVPNVFRVYVGFWMTRMDGQIRCYSEKIFHRMFTISAPDIEEWIEDLNEEDSETVGEEVGT